MPSGVYVRTEKHKGFWKGKKFSKKHKENLRKSRHPRLGINSPNWKEKAVYVCYQCGISFEYHKSMPRKFCSRCCYEKDWAKRMAENTVKYQFKKGNKPHNKGKKFPQFSGDNHPCWKGNSAKYSALHMRVRQVRGIPQHCEICKTKDSSKKYEWANLTENYADVMDYKRMCCSCHGKYDKKRRS